MCAVEIEDYPRRVLLQRQADGFLPRFPIWDDICTFDGKPWRGKIDVVSGGFPCQDLSAAGKGKGLDGERSGLWREMARVICEVQPRYAFIENSPMLTVRGLDRVLCDLAQMGFDAQWGVLGAADVGANHQRDRIWIVAKQVGNAYNNGQIASQICSSITQGSDTNSARQKQTRKSQGSSEQYEELAYPREIRLFSQETKQGMAREFRLAECGMDRKWWEREPDNASRTIERNLGGMVDGVASRVDRLKAIGNGQVPLVCSNRMETLK